MKRSPLQRRTPLHAYTRIRHRARRPRRGVVRDLAYLAFVHTQPCMAHGANCPRFVGAISNRPEAHHIDNNHRNDRRAVPLCRLAHQYSTKPSREAMEAEVLRLNALYEQEKGAAA